MRKLFSFIAVGALLFSVAGTAQAGAFDAANSALTIRLSGLPPIAIPGNAGGAVSGAGPIIQEFGTPTKAFGPVGFDLPDSLFTGVPQISDLRINGLDKPGGTATRTLSAGAGIFGGFGGIAPLSGTATICVFNCLFIQVAIPLTVVGQGGTFTGTALGQPLTVAAAAGWTTGAVTIAGINTEVVSFAGNTCAPVTCPVTTLGLGTGIGVYLATVTLTGTNNLTPNGAGMVTLVTPVITLSLAGALPLFAIQKLVFTGAPEPGTMLLLGSGVLGLVALGRRRMKS